MSIIGETEKRYIDFINVKTPYPDIQSGTQVYTAPDGLTILAYTEVIHGANGRYGYGWSTIGDNSIFLSESTVIEKFKVIFDWIEKNNKTEYRNRLEALLEDAKYQAQKTVSTHSKLILNWRCAHNGSEFNRVGGSLHIGANIEFIRSLSTRNIDVIISKLLESIKNGVPPEKLTLLY